MESKLIDFEPLELKRFYAEMVGVTKDCATSGSFRNPSRRVVDSDLSRYRHFFEHILLKLLFTTGFVLAFLPGIPIT
jgi:hypothetical protein